MALKGPNNFKIPSLILQLRLTMVDKFSMLNVNFKGLKGLFIIATLFLSGCKDPEVSVSTLGKKLSAPTLRGTNPFEQAIENSGYVQIQGACDTRVGNVYLSFDKNTWKLAPLNPDITGTTLPSGTTNDLNCSDGQFNFYLTKNDLGTIWGISTDGSSQGPNSLYLRGETLIGDTEILTVTNPSPGGGGHSPNRVATKVGLEKNFPRGFASQGMCEPFRANVLDANGYAGISTPSEITFNVEASGGAGSAALATVFANREDCIANTNSLDSLRILAGSDGLDFYYRFPDSISFVDTTMSFKVTNPSSLVADSNPASVTIRSSEAASLYRYLIVKDNLNQIYKDICYPLKLESYKYSTKSLANDSNGGSLSLTSSDASLKFFSDSGCTTLNSTFTFTANNSTLPVYVKYTSGSDTSTSFKGTSISINPSGGGTTTYTYDFRPYPLNIDMTNNNVATKMDIWGPYSLLRNSCSSYRILTFNSNGTPIPVNAATNVALGTNEANVGSFYGSGDSTCSSTATSAVALTAGQLSTIVYFKPTVGFEGTYNFKLQATALTASLKPFYVTPAPTILSVNMPSLSLSSPTSLCRPILVSLKDDLNRSFVATNTITAPIYVVKNGTASSVYTDSDCLIVMSTPTVTVTTGSSTATVYTKIDAVSVGDNITATIGNTGNLTGESRTFILTN